MAKAKKTAKQLATIIAGQMTTGNGRVNVFPDEALGWTVTVLGWGSDGDTVAANAQAQAIANDLREKYDLMPDPAVEGPSIVGDAEV